MTWPEVEVYPYRDESGRLLFEVVRYSNKAFRQRRPDGNDGWIYNLNGTRRVLYRLPEVIEAVKAGRWVVIVEGEKDSEALVRCGIVATTSPQGAGKWRPEFAEPLRGAKVCVFPDNDEPGRRHAEDVARSVSRVASKVVVVESTGYLRRAT